MAREIQTKLNAWANFTITLASLANGSARQSTIIADTSTSTGRRRAALIFLAITSGAAAPTNGAIYELFFLRGDDSGNRTDGAGASNAAITIQNAQLIGTLAVTASATTTFQDMFDTAPLGQLGTEFGIAVRNSSGQALNTTEANHIKRYAMYLPEIQ